jgi:hypothetical protein
MDSKDGLRYLKLDAEYRNIKPVKARRHSAPRMEIGWIGLACNSRFIPAKASAVNALPLDPKMIVLYCLQGEAMHSDLPDKGVPGDLLATLRQPRLQYKSVLVHRAR